MGASPVIREAKGVAIHDLSFWSQTLPLLEGLPRIIREYQFSFGLGLALQLDPGSGQFVHDETLKYFGVLQSGKDVPALRGELFFMYTDPVPPERTDVLTMYSALLARNLRSLMDDRDPVGDPEISVAVPGCGLVTGGSCDLIWDPYLVELKVTAKEPGVRDFRQLLMYAALMHIAGTEPPPNGIVANPRLGVAVQFNLAELLLMTGGLSLDEFASLLGNFLVREDVS
jgi:hypothetical protein